MILKKSCCVPRIIKLQTRGHLKFHCQPVIHPILCHGEKKSNALMKKIFPLKIPQLCYIVSKSMLELEDTIWLGHTSLEILCPDAFSSPYVLKRREIGWKKKNRTLVTPALKPCPRLSEDRNLCSSIFTPLHLFKSRYWFWRSENLLMWIHNFISSNCSSCIPSRKNLPSPLFKRYLQARWCHCLKDGKTTLKPFFFFWRPRPTWK